MQKSNINIYHTPLVRIIKTLRKDNMKKKMTSSKVERTQRKTSGLKNVNMFWFPSGNRRRSTPRSTEELSGRGQFRWHIACLKEAFNCLQQHCLHCLHATWVFIHASVWHTDGSDTPTTGFANRHEDRAWRPGAKRFHHCYSCRCRWPWWVSRPRSVGECQSLGLFAQSLVPGAGDRLVLR